LAFHESIISQLSQDAIGRYRGRATCALRVSFLDLKERGLSRILINILTAKSKHRQLNRTSIYHPAWLKTEIFASRFGFHCHQ
jgi:hypothetical protein